MKLGRLIDNRFEATFSKLIGQQMPLRAAFKLKGIAAKIQEEVGKYEDVRHKALERFGKKGEDGKLIVDDNNGVKFEPGQLELFAKELSELNQTDVVVGSISAAELGEAIQLSGSDLLILDGILTE